MFCEPALSGANTSGPDPRHVTKDVESKMPRYNEVMIVQRLIDNTGYVLLKISVWSPKLPTLCACLSLTKGLLGGSVLDQTT